MLCSTGNHACHRSDRCIRVVRHSKPAAPDLAIWRWPECSVAMALRQRPLIPPVRRLARWLPSRRIFPSRPSGSSFCSCKAPSRRWTPGSTSRNFKRTTARSARAAAHWSASKFKFSQHGQTRHAGFRSCIRTSPRTSTSCASSAGCTPTRRPTPQAVMQLHTGTALVSLTRPSMGAWLLYGLGTENQDLPGYITINPPPNFGGAANYGSAFLPAHFQGTRINDQGYLPNLRVANGARAAAQADRPDPGDEPRPGARRPAHRTSSTASSSRTSWRSRCRARCPSCSTSRRSRNTCSTPTA